MPFKERGRSFERFQEILGEAGRFQLFYFTHPECGVCHDVMPRVEELLGRHSLWEGYHVDLADDPRIGGQFSVFTVPALLVYREGREVFREARFIVIDLIEPQLERLEGLG
ncbi:MAG: thioredoxin family protein [Spirochaetales bacterium]|nr:thioredoxin family protein [Spirochaetales bacterium]